MRIMYSNVSSCFLFPAPESCFSGYGWSKKNKDKHSLASIYAWKHVCRFDVLSLSDCVYICTDQINTVQIGFSCFNHSMTCDNALVLYLVRHLKHQNCPASFNCSILGIVRPFKVWQTQNETLLLLFLIRRWSLIPVCPLCPVKY